MSFRNQVDGTFVSLVGKTQSEGAGYYPVFIRLFGTQLKRKVGVSVPIRLCFYASSRPFFHSVGHVIGEWGAF